MSFANEVKDFISSYTTVSEMGGKKKDRELRREEMAGNKEYREAMLELRREEGRLNRAARSTRESLVGDDGLTPYQRETLRLREREVDNRTAAAEETAAEEAAEAARESTAAIDTSVFDEDPGLFAPGAYQQGGLVADEEEVSEALPLSTPSAPAPAAPAPAPTPAPTPAPAAAPAAPEPAPEATRLIVRRAKDATGAALDEFERQLNTQPAAVGEGSEAPEMDPVSGEGGMTIEEVEAVRKAVDPNGTIPAHMRGAAALAELYTHNLERGDTAGAVRAAKGFLIGELNATRTLGSLSVEAFRNGDVASACRLFNDACNRFPSGHEIIVEPDQRGVLNYTVRNEGEVVEEGRLNSEQFLEEATGVANGSLFLRSAAQFVSDNDTGASSPEQALESTNQSFVEYMRARDDLQALTDATKGVDRAEIDAANERAQAALAAYNQSVSQATRLGLKRSDIEARNNRALDTALPVVPPAPPPDDRNIWERNAPEFLGGQPAPTALPTSAPAPVTPAGNNEPARPTTRQEYDALPSGTRFTAPDGSVRVKP